MVVVPALHNAVVLPVVATRVPTRSLMVIIPLTPLAEKPGLVVVVLKLPVAVGAVAAILVPPLRRQVRQLLQALVLVPSALLIQIADTILISAERIQDLGVLVALFPVFLPMHHTPFL